jgi:hypothetical protein
MKLGERFIQQGLLTPAQLEAALKAQLIFGGHLGTVLLEFGHVDEHTLGKTLAKIFGVDYAPPHLFADIPKAVLDLVPKRLVEKLHVVPFDRRERNLAVAMIDPKDLRAIDELSFATGHRIHPWVAPEARVFQVMERYYDLPRRHRYISVCQTLDAAGNAPVKGPEGPSARERAVLDSAYAPPPYLAALGPGPVDAAPDSAGPPPAPHPGAGGRSGAADPVSEETGLRSEAAFSDDLCRSESAAEIADATLRYLSGRLPRAILFLVRGDSATLWKAQGLGNPKPPTLLLPLTSEPLFALLHERDSYRGPLPPDPRVGQMMATLGMAPPREIVLLPGYLDDRLLVIVYGDSGPGTEVAAEVDSLKSIVTKIACALHLVALKRRLRALPASEPSENAPRARKAA